MKAKRRGRPPVTPSPGTSHFIYKRPPYIVKDGKTVVGTFETFEEAQAARDKHYAGKEMAL